MSRIQTVLGSIWPKELGRTLMHEHVIVDLNPPSKRPQYAAVVKTEPPISLCNCFKIRYGQMQSVSNYRLADEAVAIEELTAMKAAGGHGLVELSNGGLAPDPRALQRISQASGVHIVMGCGHYVEEYQSPDNMARSEGDFAEEMIAQVLTGAWGTEVRAGIIGEIGCQSPWTDLERRVLGGAIIAQKETGAALNVHPGRHPDQPAEIVAFAVERGADTGRLIISHIERTIFDLDRMLRLADVGCVLEFDLFGWEQSSYPLADIDMPNDAMRLRWIRALIDHGHLDRVLMSHDICTKTRLCRYGGHGYQHIPANILPLMLRRGFSDDEISAILEENPRRLLTIE